eukprot:g2530.t1
MDGSQPRPPNINRSTSIPIPQPNNDISSTPPTFSAGHTTRRSNRQRNMHPRQSTSPPKRKRRAFSIESLDDAHDLPVEELGALANIFLPPPMAPRTNSDNVLSASGYPQLSAGLHYDTDENTRQHSSSSSSMISSANAFPPPMQDLENITNRALSLTLSPDLQASVRNHLPATTLQPDDVSDGDHHQVDALHFDSPLLDSIPHPSSYPHKDKIKMTSGHYPIQPRHEGHGRQKREVVEQDRQPNGQGYPESRGGRQNSDGELYIHNKESSASDDSNHSNHGHSDDVNQSNRGQSHLNHSTHGQSNSNHRQSGDGFPDFQLCFDPTVPITNSTRNNGGYDINHISSIDTDNLMSYNPTATNEYNRATKNSRHSGMDMVTDQQQHGGGNSKKRKGDSHRNRSGNVNTTTRGRDAKAGDNAGGEGGKSLAKDEKPKTSKKRVYLANGHGGLTVKQRKNRKERERREAINTAFSQLSTVLGVKMSMKNDKCM